MALVVVYGLVGPVTNYIVRMQRVLDYMDYYGLIIYVMRMRDGKLTITQRVSLHQLIVKFDFSKLNY